MMSLADVAVAVLLTWNAAASPDTVIAARSPADAVPSITRFTLAQDTIPRPRARAFVYSEGYGTRLTIHRRLSWAMLPLFAASYFSGDQLLSKGEDAPAWARNLHQPAATGSAVLFSANAITGSWNLWEGRKDPNGRTRRIIHGLLFTAASGGFVYAGTTLADDAEESGDKRRQHRNVALGSIGVSTVSWLVMLLGN